MFVFLPLFVPLLTTILCLLAWKHVVWQRALSVLGSLALLAGSLALLWVVSQDGIQTAQSGDWPAPYGITLVADLFSAIMVCLAGLMGLSVSVYALGSIDPQREAFGFHPLMQALLLGVCGAFLTGDLFNLYVWFEVMLIASFVLVALGGERAQLEGALKYVTLNLLSSSLFLAAAGIFYSLAGTLNLADLSRVLGDPSHPVLLHAAAMLLFVAFGIKAAVFPLFFWLPASYHTPPVAVSAILAGLLTKVGVYALIRVSTLLFWDATWFAQTLMLVTAGLTMVTGVLGAASQNEFRRILSFHIISQIGYMVMGLAIFTPLALAGAVFYIVHHIIVKTNLFLIAGIVARIRGSYQLKELGGFYRDWPWLSLLFLIPALSLAGIPPLSGFWAKFALVRAGLEEERYWLVGAALAVGLLTLYSMTKIWAEVFWKATPATTATLDDTTSPPLYLLVAPAVLLAALTVTIGFSAEPLFHLTSQAADQLLNPQQYVQAVLKGD